MKQLRRLDAGTNQDPYRRALHSPLRHLALSEADFHRLERERPDHIVVGGDAVLIGQPYQGAISLQYAFPDRDAFARQFPAMFQRLLPAIAAEDAPLGLRLRLSDAPSRPYIEPVLFTHAFEVSREWILMTLNELPQGPQAGGDIAPGFVLRPARPEDAEAIAELDASAFAEAELTAEAVRTAIGQMPAVLLLEDTVAARIVGLLLLRIDRPRVGYVSEVALHPDYQRRGLGEALMRWALAWFRQEEMRSAALTVSTWNGAAIALYRKLGFVVTETGWDYRRPIDEDEVRQVLEKHRAEHIRVRGRY